MADEHDDKQFDPTPHRRQQARARGQSAQSSELNAAVVLLGGIVLVMLLGSSMVRFFGELMVRQLGGQAWLAADSRVLQEQFHWTLAGLARTVLPILLAAPALAVAVVLAQVGVRLDASVVLPSAERVSPRSGLRRMLGWAGAGRLAQGAAKIVVLVVVGGLWLRARQGELVALAGMEAPQLATGMARLVLEAGLYATLALLVLAGLDYAWRRWRHEQQLRMTREELRAEMKETEGDPQLAAHRRALQRRIFLDRVELRNRKKK